MSKLGSKQVAERKGKGMEKIGKLQLELSVAGRRPTTSDAVLLAIFSSSRAFAS
jgi:hypothetical protein